MNLFGSFNFSRLIKTFLPGFLLCIATCIYIDLLIYFILEKYYFYSFALENTVLFTVLLIPISIIFGVLSNTIFFAFGYEILIFKNFRKNNSQLYNFENKIKEKIKTIIKININFSEDLDDGFMKHIDVKAFYLNKMETEKISFLKDSFWYYLEFQMNILLGINFLAPAVLFITIKQVMNYPIHYLTLISIIFLFVSLIVALNILFINSARKNFKHHKMKYLSLLLGAYLFEKIENK